MTDEQINNLMAEFAIENRYYDFDLLKGFIEWLSKTYCIVEKHKVIGLWNEINNDAKINIENGFPDYAEFNKLQLTPIELLFGKELFKGKEE